MKRALLPCLLAVAGCALHPSEVASWPGGLPPRSTYESAWEADATNRALQDRENYLSWVLAFWEGNDLDPGWLARTRQLTAGLPEEEASAYRARLMDMGRAISVDWAKCNSLRRIDTRLIGVWGRFLRDMKKAVRLPEGLDAVIVDVRKLLEGEVRAADITPQRYADTPPTAETTGSR